MQKINTVLKQSRDVAASPRKMMEDYQAETRKGAIGIMPLYSLEELVHATGYLPMGLWGANRPVTKVHAHLPALACSIMQQVMELECEDAYDDLAAIVFSVPCDTLKRMSQKWKGKSSVLVLTHPQSKGLESANRSLKQEYLILEERLEEITGMQITNVVLGNSVHIYNENWAVIRESSQLAAQYLQLAFAVDRHAAFKLRMLIGKSCHTAMVRFLIDALKAIEPQPWDGRKITLIDILAEPDGLLEIFDQLKLAVTADDLVQELRRTRVDAPKGNEAPLYRLTRVWQDMYECSLAVGTKKRRDPMLVDMVHKNDADTVVVTMMKFYDPEEWDYPIYRRQFEEADILHLMTEVDQEATTLGQARTRL